MSTHTDHANQRNERNAASPTDAELKAVVAAVIRAHDSAKREARTDEDAKSSDPSRPSASVANLFGTLAGEFARCGIADARERELVFRELRRVASRKAKDATYAELAAMLSDPGRQATVKGFVFEAADKHGLDCLNWATRGRTHVLELFSEHNRKALDGVYREGVRVTRKELTGQAAKTATKKVSAKAATGTAKAAARSGGTTAAKKTGVAVAKGSGAKTAKAAGGRAARAAQHKCTANPQLMKDAARKLVDQPDVLKTTELVVPRGQGASAKRAVGEVMRTRESGVTDAAVKKMVKKAADPTKATHVGKAGAARVTKKALGGAGLTGVAFSVASDAKGLCKGEKTAAEAAGNASWAAAEGMASAAAAATAGSLAAPAVMAATTALAASSVAGTTAMGTVLLATGPVGVTIGTGLAVGWGFKKARRWWRELDEEQGK